ncbi:hypothetical protein BN1723_015978 [Verticillium longisporum]|uniref:Uncharacterized protein n=1 Tax=Verticillium longisporum TaxID=100787 RepID=A0A0G4N612_VERLO|nr:hypothetical protein BN1723_015978 [Verticillium longisporum]
MPDLGLSDLNSILTILARAGDEGEERRRGGGPGCEDEGADEDAEAQQRVQVCGSGGDGFLGGLAACHLVCGRGRLCGLFGRCIRRRRWRRREEPAEVAAAALLDGLEDEAREQTAVVVGQSVDALGLGRRQDGDEKGVALGEDVLDEALGHHGRGQTQGGAVQVRPDIVGA